MLDLSKYRNKDGKININLAEDDRLIEIDRNPQNSMAGAREKKWCYSKDGDFLFKRTFANNYEDYGEILGFKLAKLISLPCAEYDFAVFNGEAGVISYDIAGKEELISGSEILDAVNSFHIAPIQGICLEYYKIKKEKNSDIKNYVDKLIELYNESIIRDRKLDILIDDYLNSKNSSLDFLRESLEEHFEDMSLLYEYSFIGYKSKEMTEEDKRKKEEYDKYFESRGYEISGWNKYKKVVASNNLFDIWSLLDNYCLIKGYRYAKDQNIMLDLIKLFIFDTILSQGDRHVSNWSILLTPQTKEIRFAPIYDNSKICILDSSKELLAQKARTIISFKKNKGRMTPNKIERTQANIESSLNSGIESKLMVDYSDNYVKNNRFLMIEKLLNISDDSVYEIVKNIVEKFSTENILKIYDEVEKNHHIKIPDEVKIVVVKTIELNVEKLFDILNSYTERRKQR